MPNQQFLLNKKNNITTIFTLYILKYEYIYELCIIIQFHWILYIPYTYYTCIYIYIWYIVYIYYEI